MSTLTTPESIRETFFKIIEPAVFNHTDTDYLDKALNDLEALFTSSQQAAVREASKEELS